MSKNSDIVANALAGVLPLIIESMEPKQKMAAGRCLGIVAIFSQPMPQPTVRTRAL